MKETSSELKLKPIILLYLLLYGFEILCIQNINYFLKEKQNKRNFLLFKKGGEMWRNWERVLKGVTRGW